MDKVNLVYGLRNGKPLVTFGQEVVPFHFFNVCRALGIPYHITGGLELTHEIEVTPEEFNSMIELAEMEE